MAQIRTFRPGDLDSLYRICLATGDAGADAAHLYRDPELIGHVYAGELDVNLELVKRGMSAEWSAGFAAGERGVRWRQTLLWTAKRVAKSLGGRAYLQVRRAILERKS
jgi:hypothetical protein